MTAASPASPPPTTMMRGVAAIAYESLMSDRRIDLLRVVLAERLLRRRAELRDAGQAHAAHHQEEQQADDQQVPARALAGGDAPLGAEQPDAVGEVPRRRDQADDVEDELPRDRQLRLHFAERRAREGVQVDPVEAQVPDVPADIEEDDAVGPALEG